MASICDDARALMQEKMGENDAAHDFAHVERVVKMAMRIAEDEGIVDPEDLEVVELAALLHDYGDHKYFDNPNAPFEWLTEREYAHASEVKSIIDGVSYSVNEKEGRQEPLSILHAIVQDADRLDAIGYVGIARVFAYERGTFADTLQHFDDKLLRLLEILKTDFAREIGRERHATLRTFYSGLSAEL